MKECKRAYLIKIWRLTAIIVYPLIGVGVMLLLWFIVATVVDMEIILPTPERAFAEFFNLFTTKEFPIAVANTLLRAVESFALALVFATVLAVLGYTVPPIGKVIAPIITVLRSVPTMSIILLSIIWLKATEAPVLITFLILFPLLYAAIEGSLKNLDKYAIDMSAVFKVPWYTRLLKMYIPNILPDLFNASRSNISLGLKVMIASEVLAQTVGSMGVAMQISRVYLDTAGLMGWTIAAVLLSYVLEGIVILLAKLVVRWKR